MTQDIGQLVTLALPAVFMLTRITGLFIYSPVLSSPMIPVQVKVMLALALTAACSAMTPAGLAGFAGVEASLLTVAPIIVSELAVGLTIGFLATLPLMGMEVGGTLVGQQVGFQMAHTINPATEEDSDAVGQLMFYLGLTGFVLMGGMEGMTLAVAKSFEAVPVGGFVMGQGALSVLLGAVRSAFELGIRVAAPVLCMVFLETLAVGIMNKVAPTMNVMTFGFIVRVLVGLSVLAATVSLVREASLETIEEAMRAIPRLIDGGAQQAEEAGGAHG